MPAFCATSAADELTVRSFVSCVPLQLFKGTFYYCEGADVRSVKTKADCLKDPHNHWVNRKYNFDNLGQVSIWTQRCIKLWSLTTDSRTQKHRL